LVLLWIYESEQLGLQPGILSPAVPGLPFRRAEAWLSFRLFRPFKVGLLAARLSRHLRFAKPIPGNGLGVFSDAAAGIAARPIRYVFPFQTSGFPLVLQVRAARA
jgi:hypothetical protein